MIRRRFWPNHEKACSQRAVLSYEKLTDVNRKRARLQDMAAESLIDFDELRATLVALEETRDTTRSELAKLQAHGERLAELERDRDALMERYAGMLPETLDALSPEERHRAYKLIKLTVNLSTDSTLEVNGALGDVAEVCKEGNAIEIIVYCMNTM